MNPSSKEQFSFYVKTLGCKVNTFDSHALENQLAAKGFAQKDSTEANLIIINSCSVTANAEKEARYLARKIRREHPSSHIVITGCYAQTNSQSLVEMPEIDLVIPNEIKEQLADIVEDKFFNATTRVAKIPTGVSTVKDNKQSHFKSSATLFDQSDSAQTRAFVKIQDGCDNFCTYCLIPYARGKSRSVESAKVTQEVIRLLEKGTREIVFTGIHIGDYGQDLAVQTSLVRILAGLFPHFEKHHARLRISSLEPSEVSRPLLECLSRYKNYFCDHFHLPLQSGSDPILKKMRRSYTCEEYQRTVQMIREFFPNANIGADVIPGFPGETEEHYQETFQFVKNLNLAYLHVFPYSERPNTAAIRMPNKVSGDVIKRRAASLRKLSDELLYNFTAQFVGKLVNVIWENDQDEAGRHRGISNNYLNVALAQGHSSTPGIIDKVMIKGFVSPKQLLGKIL